MPAVALRVGCQRPTTDATEGRQAQRCCVRGHLLPEIWTHCKSPARFAPKTSAALARCMRSAFGDFHTTGHHEPPSPRATLRCALGDFATAKAGRTPPVGLRRLRLCPFGPTGLRRLRLASFRRGARPSGGPLLARRFPDAPSPLQPGPSLRSTAFRSTAVALAARPLFASLRALPVPRRAVEPPLPARSCEGTNAALRRLRQRRPRPARALHCGPVRALASPFGAVRTRCGPARPTVEKEPIGRRGTAQRFATFLKRCLSPSNGLSEADQRLSRPIVSLID